MTPDEYAAHFSTALRISSASRPRSLQTGIGVSDLGHCHSKALHKMNGVEPTDAPFSLQALHGIALHELHLPAQQAVNPRLLIEEAFTVTLPSGVRIPGHADVVDPDEPSVTDLKTVGDQADMTALRRTGSTEQQRFQRHVYYFGAHQAGLVPAEGIVRNVWVDRAGQSTEPYVEQEPFDMAVVHAADAWYQDVAYAHEHGEELSRDKHWAWCRDYCEFFSMCRSGTQNPDVEITDPEMVAAAELLRDGRVLSKAGADLESYGKRVLAPLQANSESDDISAFIAGDVRFRWQWVNKEPKGYFKINVEDLAS